MKIIASQSHQFISAVHDEQVSIVVSAVSSAVIPGVLLARFREIVTHSTVPNKTIRF